MSGGFKKSLLALSVSSIFMASSAFATNGYFAHGFGIKAKGMAGAGVAYSQDALAAATNPAGMVQVGSRIDMGVELFKPDRSVNTAWSNTAPGVTHVVEGNEDAQFFVPEFGYNKMLDNNSSFGVAVYGNGGMNASYNESIFGGTAGSANTRSNLEQLFIAPTYSMKLDSKSSFGVSLNLVYQRFEAQGIDAFCGFTPGGSPLAGGTGCNDGSAGVSDQGVDSSTGMGIRIGYLNQLTDELTVGVTYQSKTSMSEFDKYNQLFAEKGDFDIPSNYAIGIAYKATPEMNVVLDVERINYTDVAALSNPNTGFSNPTAPAGTGGALGDANGPGFGWDDMTVIKLGFDYQVDSSLVLRAGYNHGGQPISADQTLFNVLAPAVVEDHYTAGATWTLANEAELSAYFMYVPENTLKGSSPVTSPATTQAEMQNAGHSDLTMSQIALGVAYGWKF